jgi:hypothetical protein
VTYIDQTPSDESALESDRVVCRDSIDRLLHDAAALLHTRSGCRATPSPMSAVQKLGRLRRYGRAAGVLVL